MPVRLLLASLALLACSPAGATDGAPVPPAPVAATAVPATAVPATADAAAAVATTAVPAVAPRLRATLLSHSPAGRQPTTCAIADGGRTLLVANRGDNSLSIFATSDMSLTRTVTEVGYGAWGVVPRSGDQVLVSNWAGSSVAILDRATGKRLGEIPVGMKPSYLALSADGSRVYSAGNFSDDVTIADVGTRKLVKSLKVGRRPMGVALSPDGSTLWVAACDSKTISKVDLASASIAGSFPAPLAGTTNLALSPDGSLLLAAGQGGSLLLIDAATGAVQVVPVGLDTSSAAITPDGRVALVTDYANASVSLVDVVRREIISSVAVGDGPLHVETDGLRFYTCNDKAGSVSAFRLDQAEEADPTAQAAAADGAAPARATGQ